MDDVAQHLLQLLEATEQGDQRAVDEIIPLVYNELRALAAYHLQRERPDHTLQPTALVHEVYFRMLEQREVGWKSRVHFMRIAAQQIRRVLVDHARAKKRDKRGGDLMRVTLSEVLGLQGLRARPA